MLKNEWAQNTVHFIVAHSESPFFETNNNDEKKYYILSVWKSKHHLAFGIPVNKDKNGSKKEEYDNIDDDDRMMVMYTRCGGVFIPGKKSKRSTLLSRLD